MRFKIIKEIHTNQNNKVVFKVLTRVWYVWVPADIFNESDSYENVEEQIINYFSHNMSGILTIDNNIYSYQPFTRTL
jgi:hypothetical protein